MIRGVAAPEQVVDNPAQLLTRPRNGFAGNIFAMRGVESE
jgi:hypothetical protein